MTGPWIAAFGALVVMVVALTILVSGVLARVDRALDEITSRLPSNVGAIGGLEVGQAAPLLEFAAPGGGEPVQLSRSAMVFASEGCEWCAVGITYKAVDIRRLVEAAERHIILSRPTRVDHGAGTQQAAPVR